MTLINFTMFCAQVADGSKLQTIRPPRKRPIKVGERLHLRDGKRGCKSKTRLLRPDLPRCLRTRPVRFEDRWNWREMIVDGCALGPCERYDLARADGFRSPAEMLDWFEDVYGLPFEGVLIEWEPLKKEKP